MSRQLPAHASLEYLKKQAKRRLSDLERHQPEAKLADAQHAIAREYGFINWATLKSHVESRPTGPVNPLSGEWRVSQDQPSDISTTAIEFQIAGDIVTIVDIRVDASGRQERAVTTLTADGRPRPSAHGYAMTARWMGSRGLEATGTREGLVVARVLYEVSPDRRTLTIASDAVAYAGYPASSGRTVFERGEVAQFR